MTLRRDIGWFWKETNAAARVALVAALFTLLSGTATILVLVLSPRDPNVGGSGDIASGGDLAVGGAGSDPGRDRPGAAQSPGRLQRGRTRRRGDGGRGDGVGRRPGLQLGWWLRPGGRLLELRHQSLLRGHHGPGGPAAGLEADPFTTAQGRRCANRLTGTTGGIGGDLRSPGGSGIPYEDSGAPSAVTSGSSSARRSSRLSLRYFW
jgi:hypothetical protein